MNKPSDLQNAFPPTPVHYKANLQHTLDNLEELSMKKKRHALSMAVTVLVSVLIISVALAATNFGILDFFRYTDGQGTHDATKLESYVQTIGETYNGNETQLTIQDALCEKSLLAVAWTLENTQSDTPLYLDWQLSVNGGKTQMNGSNGFPNGYYWEDNNPIQAAISYNLNPVMDENEPAVIDMTFHILRPTAEIAVYDGIYAFMTEDEIQTYERNRAADAHNLKLVLDYGEAILPQDMLLDGESVSDALVRLGLARVVDSYHVSFSLKVGNTVQNLLPDNQPVSLALDGYTAVVTKAELSPMQLDYALECRFTTEQDAQAFIQRNISFVPRFDQDTSRFAEGGESRYAPESNADGTWSILYECTYSCVYVNPEMITIVPQAWENGEPVYLEDEALTLTVRQNDPSSTPK